MFKKKEMIRINIYDIYEMNPIIYLYFFFLINF